MKVLLLVTLCCAVAIATAEPVQRFDNHRVLSFKIRTEEQANIVNTLAEDPLIDVWSDGKAAVGRSFDIHVTPEQFMFVSAIASSNSLEYTVVHDNLQRDIEREERATADTGDFFSAYQPFDNITMFLHQIAKNYSELATFVTIGKTVEGRDINGVIISGQGDSKNKPAIVYNGCQHAREWISPMTVAYLINTLCANYTTNPQVKSMVDNFEITIIPVVNADGYNYTWTTNRLWRKNRRDYGGQCIGTDLNRNWGYKWNTGGSSGLQCMETYHGPSPFSEPEETAVADYVKKNGRVQGYIDFHAYGFMLMSPWGYTTELPPADDYKVQSELMKDMVDAIKAVHGNSFRYGSVANTIYIASGGSNDYTYGATDAVYSFAVELRGNSFVINASNIVPSGQEIMAGVLQMGSFLQANPRPPKPQL